MKRQRIIITVLIALSAILCVQKHVTAAPAGTPLQKQIKVEFTSTDQLNQLGGMNLDIWKIYADHIIAAVDYEKVAEIEELGFSVEIINDDAWGVLKPKIDPKKTTRPSKGTLAEEFADYHSDQEVETLLFDMEASGVAKVYDIGDSVEGDDIWAVRISDNPTVDEDEPSVLFIGCHHAREWISAEVPLYIARFLTDNYASNSDIQSLVDNQQIWIVPMLNPDGYTYSRTIDASWRKNRRNNGDGTHGVDLNRNYGYMWGLEPGSSGDTDSETYRGPSAFSEPETCAIRDLFLAHTFRSMVTYHNYGGQVAYTWGYTWDPPPDRCRDRYIIADVMKTLMNAIHGAGYTSEVYPGLTSGDTTDWTYGIFRIPSITIELRPTPNSGGSGFALPEDEILPTCEENLPAALYLIGWNEADLNNDFKVDLQDLAILSSYWLTTDGCNVGNLCCNGADIFGSDSVDEQDLGIFIDQWLAQSVVDTNAPKPDPMTWAVPPAATGETSIVMTATMAFDLSGAEYYFTCTAGGGNDSGWQESRTYEDTGLLPVTEYTYTVTARDKSAAQRTTAASDPNSAMTDAPDLTAPVPDPMTWATVPATSGSGELLVYEPFNYTPGSFVHGLTVNATGLTGTWTSTYTDSKTRISAPTLSYSTLPVGGANLTMSLHSSAAVEAALNTTEIAGHLDDGDVLWFSFIADTIVTVAGNHIRVQIGSDANNNVGLYMNNIDHTIAQIRSTITVGGDEIVSEGSASWTDTTGRLVVGKISFGATDTVEAYLPGPDLALPASPVGTVTGSLDQSTFDMLRIKYVNGNTMATDEIRIGTTYYEVTCQNAPIGGDTTVIMTASTATDINGVEYFFDCNSVGGHDSGWQDRPEYTDTGLTPSTMYSYRVKTRDKSLARNVSGYSPVASVITDVADTDAPTPDPMAFSSLPAATGEASIAMIAALATDISSVEYYFDCNSVGGHNSGWQASRTYEDTGLLPATEYTYTVTARDKSYAGNETDASNPASATTDVEDTVAPTPFTMTWNTVPVAIRDSAVFMIATTASDINGVEYYFTCTAGGGHNSGWQDSPSYTDTGLTSETLYIYTVTARDKSPNQNATFASPAASTTTLEANSDPYVVMSKSVYAVNEPIVVFFTNADGNATDWVAFFYPASPSDSDTYDDIQWMYTDGTKTGTPGIYDGTLNFDGRSADTYQARLHFNDGYTIQASCDFTVE